MVALIVFICSTQLYVSSIFRVAHLYCCDVTLSTRVQCLCSVLLLALLYPVRTYFPKLFLSIPFFPSPLSEVILLVIQLVSFARVCIPSWFPGHLVWYIYICLCIYVFVGIGSESQHAGSSLCHTALSLQRMDSPYAVHGAHGISWSNPCPRRCKVDSWPLEPPVLLLLPVLYCSVFMKYKAHTSWYPVLPGLVNTWPRMHHHSTTPCYVYEAAPYLFFF